nr:unnamed protein product [Callosobruchus analis]
MNDCIVLQRDIETIFAWSISNQLELNLDKSFIVSYTRKYTIIMFPYSMNNTTLKRQEEIRVFGIIFDQKMSFAVHTESTASAANMMLGFIIRNGRELSISVITRLCA